MKISTKQSFYTPIKIGLLIVVLVFFLFTLHGILTLAWIGEWEGLETSTSFWIFITDISSAIGLVFRFIGSLVAAGTVIFYFVKKGISRSREYRLIKIILILEAIYWFTFITSGIWGITPLIDSFFSEPFSTYGLIFLISMGIPCLFESIFLPIALFKIIFKLNPNLTKKGAIKWGLIAGSGYIFVWWFNNAGLWITTVMVKGIEYLTIFPANLLSFVFTIFGLLLLGVFSAFFYKRSIGAEDLDQLKLKTIGLIIIIAGFYFLWNYLTWIFFGKPEMWSDWYAWFLGHNLDLWALSLPLLGIAILFKEPS